MYKFPKLMIPLSLLLIILLFVSRPMLLNWEAPAELPRSARTKFQKEITTALSFLDPQPTDVDILENELIEAGLAVLDTDMVYPTYLANHTGLLSFWDSAQKIQNSSFLFFSIPNNETLRCLYFLHSNGETSFFTADVHIADRTVIESAYYPVHEMELSDWDIFYYRLFPAGDPHYIDYSQIRLNPADKILYDACRKYILPVGYQMVNLFLVDWSEENWGTLSFHDTLEFLYARNTGETLLWEDYPRDRYPSRVRMPAEIFETHVLPYFNITQEELRSHCGYDAETRSYPYRAIRGDDLTTRKNAMCEPEVMEIITNSNGTLTLRIQVYSPELKTDRLFCHDLTVRPLEGEDFQYVGNKVTYVSSFGLPPTISRFELDK